MEERFWKYVSKGDGCWKWIGADRGNGYGCLKVKGKILDAHRISWEIHFGKIEEGKLVCHSCNNRNCVNPNHLYLGSYKDNVSDSISNGTHHKGFGLKGEKHPKAKLSYNQVEEIRELRRNTKLTVLEIAKKYKVARTTISGIVNGKRWS